MEALVFPIFDDAGTGDGVSAVCIGLERGRRIHRNFIQAGGHLMVAVEDFFVGDFLARVCCHAAHAGYEAGLDTAFGFVVGLIIADGVYQDVPFVLIWTLFFPPDFGFPDHFFTYWFLAPVRAGWHTAVAAL